MSLKQTSLRLSARAFLSAERLFRSPRQTASPSILILEYLLPLGCCVHLTPVYEAIRRSVPHATITVATRGLGLSLLRHQKFIDHLIETPDPFASLSSAAKALRAELSRRSISPSHVLTGASDQRSRIALLAMLAVSAPRGGFTVHRELYQQPLSYDWNCSLIDNNLRLLPLLGGSPEHVEPRVFFSSSDAEKARALAHSANPDGRSLAIFVTQNSGGQRTGWHTSRFVQVIRHAHTLGCAVAYVGTEKDRAAIEEIRQAAGGIGVSLAGNTSVTELAALLALSDIGVSLDTGTMHVARSVGLPTVVLGPSWQKPLEWLPLELPQARILRGKDRDRSEIPPNYQLDEIEASAVIAALEELLKAYPPNAASREKRIAEGLSSMDHLATKAL